MPSTEVISQLPSSLNGHESLSLKARRRRMETQRSKIESSNGPLSEPSLKRLRHSYYLKLILEYQNPKCHSSHSTDSTVSSNFETDFASFIHDSSNEANFYDNPNSLYSYRFLKQKIEKLGADSDSESESDQDEPLDTEIKVENLELDNASPPQKLNLENSSQNSANMDIDQSTFPGQNQLPSVTPSQENDESLDTSVDIDTISTCCVEHRFGKPADECPAHGSHAICGRRREMEDAFATMPCFITVPCDSAVGCQYSTGKVSQYSVSTRCKLHFFGVYDGHGGYQAAQFCSKQLHRKLSNEIKQTVNSTAEDAVMEQYVWKKIFTDTFKKTDAEIEPIAPETVGSTAVVTVISPSQIIVSNCGDSRAVLSRAGKAIALSRDHKPDREDEMQRIEAAGGRVIFWNGFRVLGVLAMSRALGDRYLKPYVIPEPDLTFTTRSADDECIVMATDGLWDVLNNETACEIARRYLNQNGTENLEPDGFESEPPAVRAAAILTRIAFNKGSGDNISVVVIDLKSLYKK